ncbi:ABC transporter substrate-binding protein [Streptomyces sp. 110]|uniref:ABC transporter substrate-binding protein n=1 Tax=Streptomyces endocoffeicus TaxID=2898945 RepID=A0ABS1Q5L4_9ACTN|nr:ABC transporter substrate-binding protein [Streptomyces endocoffeicus]MBL1119849.1 ABC transporter substrate-binding protein [Streptomyces endocoffeicus]
MRWRITVALASLGLLAGVTSCGTSNTKGGAVSVYYTQASLYADPLKTAIKPLEKEPKAPRVNLVLAGKNYNDVQQRIIREAGTGRLPDVALVGLNNLRGLVDLGIAQPLDSAMAKGSLDTKNIDPKFLKLTQYNGKQYGIPYGVATRILYANADMFKAAGLDPTHLPTTWSELRKDATKLADPAKHKYGIVMDWNGGSNIDFQQQLASAGGTMLNPGETGAAFNSPQGRAVVNYWRGLVKDKAMPLLARTSDTSPNVQAFINGDAGMLIQSNGNLGNINKSAKFTVATGQAPIKDGGTRSAPASGAAIVLLTKDPHRQEAALKAIQQLASPTASTALTLASGYIPVNSVALKSPELKKYFSEKPNRHTPLDAIPHLNQWQTYPGSHDVEANDAIEKSLLQALGGSESPEKALTESQNAVNEILKNHG